MTRDIDLAVPPTNPNAALGYADIYELWKADQGASTEATTSAMPNTSFGWHGGNAPNVGGKKAVFDEASRDNSIDEFRTERSVALARILRGRHGLPVATVEGKLRPAS
jgi:hypothetical protein